MLSEGRKVVKELLFTIPTQVHAIVVCTRYIHTLAVVTLFHLVDYY